MFKSNQEDSWFYSEPGILMRMLLIYVNGDKIGLIPVIIGILLSAFISIKFMFLMMGFYLAIRGLGEMIYWLLQQFGEKTYRPASRFNKLSNNSIYIIYQTYALRDCLIGIGLILYLLIK